MVKFLCDDNLFLIFSSVTITGPRPFFATAKQRAQPKTFFKADNSDRLSDKEERSPNNNTSRRPLANHRSNGSNNFVQKENSEIYLRRMHQIRNKRDEIVPRFQVCFSILHLC